MESHNSSGGSHTIYLIGALAMLTVVGIVKLLKPRSRTAAKLDAWLQSSKNRTKLQAWVSVGFFFLVFGTITLAYELTH